MEHEALVDGNLATEASLVVLDTLEIIVQVGFDPAPFLISDSHPGAFCFLLYLAGGGSNRTNPSSFHKLFPA